MEKLREEFAKKVRRKATALQDICDIVEDKLAQMLALNPARMDYQRKYEEIVADYNNEKDRTTIEETFRRLVELVASLDEEQQRATREGLDEDELALFDLLRKDGLDAAARERVKQASRELLAAVKARSAELDRVWEKEQTKADVEVFILDEVYAGLPTPPFAAEEKGTAGRQRPCARLAASDPQRRVFALRMRLGVSRVGAPTARPSAECGTGGSDDG